MATELSTADLDDRCRRFLDRAEQIRSQHVITAVVELGEAAVSLLYDGDVERAHDRSAAREMPLTALVERHGERFAYVGLSIDGIRTAIRAWDVDRQLPPASRGRLLPTTLRALAVLPSPADRALLANQAVVEQWTLDQVAQKVAETREQAGVRGKGGRPPLPAPLKRVRAAGRELGRLGEPTDVAEMAPAARKQLRQELEQVVAAAQVWLGRL